MTAEIAVMNRLGVALAADSIGSVQTALGLKTYNSNKLFTLSKYRPVGVMIFGNAALMGIPWEVIIKSYRNQLGDKSCDTLEEYAAEFFTHLDNNTFYFPPNLQRDNLRAVALDYYRVLTEAIDEKVRRLTAKGKIAPADVKKAVTKVVKEHLAFITGRARLSNTPSGVEANILQKYDRILNQAIKKQFKKYLLPTPQPLTLNN
jgi:hypothetical protein